MRAGDPYGSAETALAYSRKRRGPARALGAWREAALARRAVRGAPRILDCPCGAGRFSADVACDLSFPMLALARRRVPRVVRADAARLPFRDGAFDAALCVRLLHHFDETAVAALLGELARVARVAAVTYFATTGVRGRRRLRRGVRHTRRGLDPARFAEVCTAAGWRVAWDRALLPFWSEQHVARLER